MSDEETASDSNIDGPPAKRLRPTESINGELPSLFEDASNVFAVHSRVSATKRSISPPPLKRTAETKSVLVQTRNDDEGAVKIISSQVQLTRISDLPQGSNVDTVGLEDLIGDPLIKEAWQFNFLFDIEFLMSAFDKDVQQLVKVKIVHGFWKQEDASRLALLECATRYPNVELITAHMPEPFGTHHSKMMVLFRNDDTAQVIIHTANMIARDWANLSQAVWCSPILPLLRTLSREAENSTPTHGEHFKSDLLNYLCAYGERRTGTLTSELRRYDFRSIRAALVASVPGKRPVKGSSKIPHTLWGWQGLERVLRNIPSSANLSRRSTIVVQISSIATLGQSDSWLKAFFKVLETSSKSSPTPFIGQSTFRIIFPTADEVRRSLDGYEAGCSIHTKIQSSAQQKQLNYMRPMMCYWAGDGVHNILPKSPTPPTIREAGRRRAAPHIKTYIRFANSDMNQIEWAMITSANLSTQAWGGLPSKDGDVRICSYEIGVVLWPQLFAEPGSASPSKMSTTSSETGSDAVMVPTFMTDDPPKPIDEMGEAKTIVGFRMPYDLPLVRYIASEEPWCASSSYLEPDWKGKIWQHDSE